MSQNLFDKKKSFTHKNDTFIQSFFVVFEIEFKESLNSIVFNFANLAHFN